MKYLEIAIPEKVGYLIPIGDLHIGDKSFKNGGENKLLGYLKWVKENNAKIFLMGDIFNCASRISKTSPFETNTDEFALAHEIFEPYQEYIIGIIDGNHEGRPRDMFGWSPAQSFARELKIPYCGWSAVIRLKVDKRQTGSFRQNYFIYAHHTTGGGGSAGSGLNQVVKLRNIIEGVDVYMGAHNHKLIAFPQEVYYPSCSGGIKKRTIWHVDCGSYLGWEDSYAEKGMMAPSKLGSPRIRFAGGDKHDVHVSL